MTLPALSLDDMTYEDLRQMAMRQIPAASAGQWTHHEPTDAGVTLLELFAFLLEQQLFVLDQAPDSLTLALLGLLGESPADAGVARMLVAPALPVVGEFAPLEYGTLLNSALGGLGALTFSIENNAFVLPVNDERIFANGGEITDYIDRGETIEIMVGESSELSLQATFSKLLPPEAANVPLNVAIVLAENGVPAQWQPGATQVSAPFALSASWQTNNARGVISDWSDGTNGLRRSGLIRCKLPAEIVGAQSLTITLTGNPDAFAAPPALQTMRFNASIAAHRQRIELSKGSANPTYRALYATLRDRTRALLPNSEETLELPTELSPVLAATIELQLADRNGVFHQWNKVNDRTGVERDARVYSFNRDFGRFEFGDGIAGRVAGYATDIKLGVDIVGGSAGNHVAGMQWVAADARSLVSITDATGGTEAETLEAARARVAAGLNQQHRAVTADDYITLTETTPGIGGHRAHVVAGFNPEFPCHQIADTITVFVVPHTSSNYPTPRADDGAMAAIRERLDDARMLTTRVIVAHPHIRPVDLTIELATASKTATAFDTILSPALSTYLHPTLGGPTGNGWPFGGPLRPSELLNVANDALEGLATVERVAIKFSDQIASREEDCTELNIGSHDLVSLNSLRIHLTAIRSIGPTL